MEIFREERGPGPVFVWVRPARDSKLFSRSFLQLPRELRSPVPRLLSLVHYQTSKTQYKWSLEISQTKCAKVWLTSPR